jgi:nitroreductase
MITALLQCPDFPVEESIRSRVSWRSFERSPLDEQIEELSSFSEHLRKGIFGSELRFIVHNTGSVHWLSLKRLGTYGMIKGSSCFVVGCVKKSEHALLDFGFAMELLILKATSMGLGTCWLGGTFKRSGFASLLDAKKDELVPAISPVGKPAFRRHFLDYLAHGLAGSAKRKRIAEFCFKAGVPWDGEGTAWNQVLEWTQLSPSSLNKQPWRLLFSEDLRRVDFFSVRNDKKKSKNSGKSDKVDLTLVDMGIAMCHFDLATREQGMMGNWSFQPCAHPDNWDYQATWTY